MNQATRTPLEPGLIDRVVRGVRYMVSGRNPQALEWFGPQQPMAPAAQEAAQARRFDFPAGYNTQIQPRAYEPVSFAQLRALADNLDLLRLVIETRKDLVCKLAFEFKPQDPQKEADQRCEQLRDFFRFPDQEHSWEEWLRMLLEDLLVLDAPTLYPRMNMGGGLYALEPLDGATVKRVIDGSGRTPLPPQVAYQQVIKGVPAVDYSRDELIYKPRNVRTHRVYGYSPVEQILMTVNIALRRQLSQLQYYSEGSTPDLILQVPPEWSPDQLMQFKTWWDSVLAGNSGARRGTMFVPSGVSPVNTKDGLLKDQYDEWLARVICYAFGISPNALIAQQNRATAQSLGEQVKEEGLAPIMVWVKGLVDYVVWKYFGWQDLHLVWVDSKDPDPLQQAQINQIYVNTGVKQVNEVREELGLQALSELPEPVEPSTQSDMASARLPDKNPDDAPDAEKLFKAAPRALAPVGRSRQKVRQARNRMQRVLQKRFAVLAPRAAQQLAAAFEARTKMDLPRHDVESVLASLDLDWDVMVPEVADLLAALAIDGAVQAAVQLQITDSLPQALDLANERASEYARTRAAEMVGKRWVDGQLQEVASANWQIGQATQDMLRTQVTQAIDEGLSAQQLAQAIEESGAFSAERALMIARTETAMADVQGNVALYQAANQSGVEVYKRWITAGDDRVSEDCQLNGESPPLPMDEEFPSGAQLPPEHPNCRCDIAPVLFTDLVDEAATGF